MPSTYSFHKALQRKSFSSWNAFSVFHRKSFFSHCISIQLELCVCAFLRGKWRRRKRNSHHFNALPKVMMVVWEKYCRSLQQTNLIEIIFSIITLCHAMIKFRSMTNGKISYVCKLKLIIGGKVNFLSIIIKYLIALSNLHPFGKLLISHEPFCAMCNEFLITREYVIYETFLSEWNALKNSNFHAVFTHANIPIIIALFLKSWIYGF